MTSLPIEKAGEAMSQRSIFISHARADREWVRTFAESLTAQGVQVWLDELQIPAGERLEKAMEQGFRGSDVIAFVITPDNVRSPNLLFELGAALGMGKRAVPILSKDVDTSELPYPLRVRRFLARESPEETAKKLVAGNCGVSLGLEGTRSSSFGA
jgi:hypothetical protein